MRLLQARYKKDLHDPDNHDDVITHLEPDILKCEVRWFNIITTTLKPPMITVGILEELQMTKSLRTSIKEKVKKGDKNKVTRGIPSLWYP